jgi:hypothetical protein
MCRPRLLSGTALLQRIVFQHGEIPALGDGFVSGDVAAGNRPM